jgi:hypothetical protein
MQGSSLQFAFSTLSTSRFPEQVAEAAATAEIGQHRVVQLKVYPVQYDAASQTLTQYRDIRVRLDFQAPATLVSDSDQEGHFTRALSPLLAEYDLLSRWNAPLKPLTDDHVRFGGPAFKVTAPGEGLYQLTAAQLSAAGVNLLDPEHLRLFCRNKELPLDVTVSGGRVTEVRFFAPKNETPYSTDTVLFLVNDGVTGLRMSAFDASVPPGLGLASHYDEHLRKAERHFWWRQMPNDGASDRWFMDWLDLHFANRPNSDVTMPVSDLAASGMSAMLKVDVRGEVTDAAVNQNNHVAVAVNGQPVGEILWHGTQAQSQLMTFAADTLHDGLNTVRVTLLNDRGARVPVALISSVELDYPRRFTAQSGLWTASLPKDGQQAYEVTGFSGALLGVYDVTDPWHVRKANQAEVGATSVRFADPSQSGGEARYWICDTAGAKTPTITAYQPDDLRATSRQVDYLVITPEAFRTAADRLAGFRERQGLHSRVVDVQAIYDEFGGGHPEPEAIKAFLAWTVHNWPSPAPTYVVLLGDGSFDYRNDYQDAPDKLTQFIPPHLRYSPGIGMTADDNWYACVVGDDALPDLFIGRLPADSEVEADTMVGKVIDYERQPAQAWQSHAVAVTDENDPRFGLMTQEFRERYAGRFNWQGLGVGDPQALANQLDQGAGLTLYVGHGGIDLWADENVLSADMALGKDPHTNLQPNGKPGIVVAGNCLTAYFQDPWFTSLGEALLKAPDRGGVAYLAANGYTTPDAQAPLLRRFFRFSLEHGQPVGAAMAMAKIGLFMDDSPAWQDEVASWLLLGDPATGFRPRVD